MEFFDATAKYAEQPPAKYSRNSADQPSLPAAANIQSPPDFPDFPDNLPGFTLGEMTVCHLASNPATFQRRPLHIPSGGIDDIIVAFIEEGALRQDESSTAVRAGNGDIIAYAAARPLVPCLDATSIFFFRFTKQLLLARFAQLEHRLAVKIAEHSSMSDLLLAMAKEACKLNQRGANDLVKAKFSQALLETLSTALQLEIGAGALRHKPRHAEIYQRALYFIQENLADHRLSSQNIAEHVCVSERTLARIFAAHGGGIAQTIWSSRLQKAKKLITSGQVRQVSEAAAICGFSEMSHFSKAFRAEFGDCPKSFLSN